MRGLRQHFDWRPGIEASIEVHPPVTTASQIGSFVTESRTDTSSDTAVVGHSPSPEQAARAAASPRNPRHTPTTLFTAIEAKPNP